MSFRAVQCKKDPVCFTFLAYRVIQASCKASLRHAHKRVLKDGERLNRVERGQRGGKQRGKVTARGYKRTWIEVDEREEERDTKFEESRGTKS